MSGESIHELKVGDAADRQVCISASSIERFTQVTGNFNNVYFHEPSARKRGLEGKIVPQAMLDAIISSLIGEKLPGPGSLIMSVKMDYALPLAWDEPVQIHLKIEKIMPKSNKIVLASYVIRADNKVACAGKWVVSPRPETKN